MVAGQLIPEGMIGAVVQLPSGFDDLQAALGTGGLQALILAVLDDDSNRLAVAFEDDRLSRAFDLCPIERNLLRRRFGGSGAALDAIGRRSFSYSCLLGRHLVFSEGRGG